MDSNVSLVFLPLFINRITEVVKKALIERAGFSEELTSTIVLAVSLVLGALGVIFVFPATNLIPGQGASLLAEQIVTGVVIGGLANGIDFLGRQVSGVMERPAANETTITTPAESKSSVSATVQTTSTPSVS